MNDHTPTSYSNAPSASSSEEIQLISVTENDDESEKHERDGRRAEVTFANGATKSTTHEYKKLASWFEKARAMRKRTGLKYEMSLRKNKNFRNPVILEKMISFCDLDQFGSNMRKAELTENQYYDQIAEEQRKIAMQRAKRQS